MKLEIHSISDKGKRTNNEDMVLVGTDIFRDDLRNYEINITENQKPYLIAVADGMGGHNAGEYASELVLQNIFASIGNLPGHLNTDELKNHLEQNIKKIHSILLTEGENDLSKKGMGSTFCAIIFYFDNIYSINIGDSRLYRYRDGILVQLTRDHSLREFTGDKNIPKNIIVNSFGGGEKIFFDFECITKKVLPDDILLLCTDGLTDGLNDMLLEQIIEKNNKVPSLIQYSIENGSVDNISCIYIKILP